MKRIFSILMVVALLAAFGASCSKKHGGHEAAKKEDDRPPVSVKTVKIEKQTVPGSIQAVGTVMSGRQSTLSARVMGIVLDVSVKEGDTVAAGQTVAVLDARDIDAKVSQAKAGAQQARAGVLQAQAGVAQAQAAVLQAQNARVELQQGIAAAEAGLAQARAQAELAEKTYRRFEELKKRGSVSDQEFDQVEAQKKTADAAVVQAEKGIEALKAKEPQIDAQIQQAQEVVNQGRAGMDQASEAVNQAEAGIREAEIMRDHAVVTAPFNGIVVKKHTDPGQMAAPGVPIVTIEDPGGYRLEVQVEESEVAGIKIGDVATVTLDAIGGEPMQSVVDEIVPAGDPASRTFTVKVSCADKRSGVRSGMYGKAVFESGEDMRILVPAGAVVTRGQMQGVFTVENERARWRLIKTGAAQGKDNIEILSGLDGGETVVASNTDQLTDGRKVVISK